MDSYTHTYVPTGVVQSSSQMITTNKPPPRFLQYESSLHTYMHARMYVCRLRNDLYCVEWDVKL